MEPRFALTHPGESKKRHTLTMTEDGRILAGDSGDPFTNLVPVDQDMMFHSLEAKGTMRSNAAEEKYIATVHRDKLPCLTMRDDGSYAVELVDAPGHYAFAFDDAPLTGQAVEKPAEKTQAQG